MPCSPQLWGMVAFRDASPELVAWSIVAGMRVDEFDLPMADGVDVHVRRWRPDSEPHAVVQIAHGMAEHGGRYARLAGVLVDAGHAVWAHDHRGHGLTARTDDDLGHFADQDGFDLVVDDLLAVRAELGRAGQDGAGRPVALLAHSMGTFISQAALALRPPSPWDSVILAGSDAPGGSELPGLPADRQGRTRAPWPPWAQHRAARSRLRPLQPRIPAHPH